MSTLNVGAIEHPTPGSAVSLNGTVPSNRNRIINGDMRIDQRNAGASITPTAWTYTVDRWQLEISQASKLSVQQNAGSVTPPAGFTNYLGITSTSAYTPVTGDYFEINQPIEGFNTADFGWGASGAQTVTLSFWVRSSLTGTHSGALRNSANTRSYPFTFTISSANTWEYKTVSVEGDTSGTWLTNNGAGIQVGFSLGGGTTFRGTAGAWAGADYRAGATGAVSVVGTNGATFYITGVQLEAGSVATPFERRQYGQELALCQRYYFQLGKDSLYSRFGPIDCNFTTSGDAIINPFVEMRSTPTMTTTGTASHYAIYSRNAINVCTSVPFLITTTPRIIAINCPASGLTIGSAGSLIANSTSGFLGFSAEL